MIKKESHCCLRRFFRSLSAIMCIAALMAGTASCKKEEPLPYYTVESPESTVPESAIVGVANTVTELKDGIGSYYTDASGAKADFEKYGYPDSAAVIYSEAWFQRFNLASVILLTNTSFGYVITDVKVSEKEIRLDIQEIRPPAYNDLGQYQAFLVGIPKDQAPDDAAVTVNMQTVSDKQQ